MELLGLKLRLLAGSVHRADSPRVYIVFAARPWPPQVSSSGVIGAGKPVEPAHSMERAVGGSAWIDGGVQRFRYSCTFSYAGGIALRRIIRAGAPDAGAQVRRRIGSS